MITVNTLDIGVLSGWSLAASLSECCSGLCMPGAVDQVGQDGGANMEAAAGQVRHATGVKPSSSFLAAGVGRGDVGVTRMWYRRDFTVPEDWLSQHQNGGPAERIMLRFGAVDWETEVFVNGMRMGMHRGG